MTIPTLMNNTNKQEYVSRLKKAYSTLSQATNKIITDEGMPRADMGGWATSAEAVFNMYQKYLSNTKVCGKDIKGCFAGSYKLLNGGVENSLDNRYTLVMSDGAEISVGDLHFSDNCSHSSEMACQIIDVDVNGAKGPNAVGIDTFTFILRENGLVPAGCDVDKCRKGTDSGWSCACKVLREGAINY